MKLRSVCALSILVSAMAFPVAIHAHDFQDAKSYNTDSYLSDDIAAVQYYIHNTKDDSEHSSDKSKDKSSKHVDEHKKKDNDKKENKDNSSKKEDKDTPSFKGHLRLSITNDSREEMIRKLNRFWAGHGLAGQGEAAVNAGIRHNIDPYILAAISMTESTGGDYNAGSHNAWGRKASGGGWCNWGSWSEALDNEAAYLANNYLDRGITSLSSIARIYCPPTSGHWCSEVLQHQREVANR